MSQNIIHLADSEVIRLGKDEMNLIEHPFGSLSKEKDTRHIELHWKTQHPLSKKVLDAYWKVRGDANLGLPTANDEKVYLVAMELTRESAWNREVHFTRSDFLRRLGWTDNDEAYRRLHEAFLRLTGVLIEARNAFYHPKSGHYIDGGFHLIDTFMIAGEGPGRKSRERLNQPLTYFVWNKIVHESFIAGNIRSLDLEFALSLERPLSLRLFRYLDKKRYGGRQSFEVGLRELCGVHLGMVIEGRYDSNLKASLKAAHSELMARGFLTQATYEKMKTRKGLKVVYTFAKGALTQNETSSQTLAEAALTPQFSESTSQSAKDAVPDQLQLLLPDFIPGPVATFAAFPPLPPREEGTLLPSLESSEPAPPIASTLTAAPVFAPAAPPAVAALTALGISPSVAQELSEDFSPEQIQLQIDCLPDRNPKNPAAALVKSIRQGWSPPPSYGERLQAIEQGQKAQSAQQQAVEEQRASKARDKEHQAALAAEMQELDARWEALDAPTRARIESAARSRLGILGQAGRAPGALAAMRRTLLRELSTGEGASPDPGR